MNSRGVFRRRHLPHWDRPGALYFVTACLQGAVTDEDVAELQSVRRRLAGARARGDPAETEQLRRLYARALRAADERWDQAPRVRWLEQPALANEIRQSLHFFAGVRYHLLEYVVMPSHLHWVFEATEQYEASFRDNDRTPREVILQSLKSYTGRACNRLLGRSGQFWQQESYDHWVRNERELCHVLQYVRNNPVRAGLAATPEEWGFSSAHDRKLWGVPEGMPLRPPRPTAHSVG